MKCPQCGQIVRKDHGQLVSHACFTPRPRKVRRARPSGLERWAAAYLDSEGHERIGGPEDR